MYALVNVQQLALFITGLDSDVRFTVLLYFGFFRLLVPVGSFLHARVTAFFSLTQNIYITVDMGSGSSKEKAALSSQLDELNQKYVGMHHEGRWRVAY